MSHLQEETFDGSWAIEETKRLLACERFDASGAPNGWAPISFDRRTWQQSLRYDGSIQLADDGITYEVFVDGNQMSETFGLALYAMRAADAEAIRVGAK